MDRITDHTIPNPGRYKAVLISPELLSCLVRSGPIGLDGYSILVQDGIPLDARLVATRIKNPGTPNELLALIFEHKSWNVISPRADIPLVTPRHVRACLCDDHDDA